MARSWKLRGGLATALLLIAGVRHPAVAQQTQPQTPPATIPQTTAAPDTSKPSSEILAVPEVVAPEAAAPRGTVLFERKTPPVVDGETPEVAPVETKSAGSTSGESSSVPAVATAPAVVANDEVVPAVQDAERSALTFTAYDLDAHLIPAASQLVMHARFTVKNDGTEALKRALVQVSSSLRWERFGLADAGGKLVVLPFVQHVIDTDADHTGGAQEAVVTLAEPLAVGASVELSAFYGGAMPQSSKRLERIGAPGAAAGQADWDQISQESTALRGFGDVLWYPVASVPVFLGDGAKLFQAVGRTKLRQSDATIRLRLTVEYVGDAPKVAYFCGRGEPMMAMIEDKNSPSVSAPGIASAEFAVQRIGFRVPSLFIPDGALKRTDSAALTVLTDNDDAVTRYGKAEQAVEPLLTEWLGETPQRTLTILDHSGQPFEDDALLVAPMAGLDSAAIATTLVHSLSHAWLASPHVWLDEGMAQFMGWLWIERTQGREAAMQQISQQTATLAFAEPVAGKDSAFSSASASVPAAPAAAASKDSSLLLASDEVYYRTKAAAVLWMLRSVAGEAALKEALHKYRGVAAHDLDGKEFQRTVEEASHKDLHWFFDDWVDRDRGLADLSIVSVNSRELTAKDGRGGYLIAVEVRNDGDAVAEVPVTVRNGTLTATERVRVAGRTSASTRILFEGTPAEVVMNDGSVPEVGASTHTKGVRVR
jgi:hypothetical protein